MKRKRKKPYFPRVVPTMKTSSSVFVPREKRKSYRRILNREAVRMDV